MLSTGEEWLVLVVSVWNCLPAYGFMRHT